MKKIQNPKVRKAVRIVLRSLLVLFTLVFLAVGGLCMVLGTIFYGPSESAREVLTMSLLEPSATKWIPGLFLGKEKVAQITAEVGTPLLEEFSDSSQVVINTQTNSDEWKDYPDGIRIETVYGSTYTAHVMIIRDPSQVYLATSTDGPFSTSVLGTRLNEQIETEGAIAAINAGAFNDDGSPNSYVGSVPIGMVISEGTIRWDDGNNYEGFVGFNTDNILVVASSMDAQRAKDLKIRDGCCFGPVLLMNGVVNQIEYSSNSGYNPRTGIGQRDDGAVIFVCIDGRQASSLGGTYSDLTNIMVEYGAVNACNLDGGSSSVMYYRDVYGRYGDAGRVMMVNSHSMLQSQPRRMPTFFMVRPAN